MYILRTSWLYGAGGYVDAMLTFSNFRKEISVVDDQIGSPTNAYDLAEAIVKAIPQIKEGEKEVFHFTNEGACSWYDFAKEIMEQSKLNCKVNPIEAKDYPTPAHRPHYSVLNKAKIKRDFGIKINNWAVSLAECVEKMNNGF